MDGFTNQNNYNYAVVQQNKADNVSNRQPEEYEGPYYAQQDAGDCKQISNLMVRALDNMENGSYNKAFELFQTILNLDPKNETANYNSFLCQYKIPDIPTRKEDIRSFKSKLQNDRLADPFFVQAKKYAGVGRKMLLNDLEWRCREIYRLDEVRDLLRVRKARDADELLKATRGWLQDNSRVTLYPDYFQELQSELEYQNNYLTYCREVEDPDTYIARMMQQRYPQELNTAKKWQRKAGGKRSDHPVIDILFAIGSISLYIECGVELLAQVFADSAIYNACYVFLLCVILAIFYVPGVKSVGGVFARLGIIFFVLPYVFAGLVGTGIDVTAIYLAAIAVGLPCMIKSFNRILVRVSGHKFRSYMANTILSCEQVIRADLSNRWDSIIRQEDRLYLTPFSLEESVGQKGQSARGKANYSQEQRVQTDLQDCYEGDQPYVFVSYAHIDHDRVFPIVARLQKSGYRIWLDTNITPGSEWDSEIAQHLFGSSLVIAMLSRNYLNSENCKDELNTARDKNINQLLIYLEAVDLPSGMEMRFGRSQHLVLANYDNNEDFYTRLLRAEGLRPCRGGH